MGVTEQVKVVPACDGDGDDDDDDDDDLDTEADVLRAVKNDALSASLAE